MHAETEEDFQETVKFAAKHNLRLVVKATGHDWYGRSYAPDSVVLWTHKRKKMTWHDAFVATGSSTAVPAVTVESGVQFSDMYPAAQATPYPNDPQGRKSIVMGGTCDSVGVGGCWMGGCYGPFTKLFGNRAINLLEAKIVLANGTLVTCSESQHPELFWTIRGGGGGNTGVVTQLTARTHPAPQYTVSSGFNCQGEDMAGFKACTNFVMKVNMMEFSLKMMNYVLKMMIFVFKMMSSVSKNDDFSSLPPRRCTGRPPPGCTTVGAAGPPSTGNLLGARRGSAAACR